MRYTFGDYVLDTQRAELQGAGRPIKLRRKVLQVLAYLLAHHDRVVLKEELLAQLWPEQFVGDETLKSCLKTLRQALGIGAAPRVSCAHSLAAAAGGIAGGRAPARRGAHRAGGRAHRRGGGGPPQ